MSDGVQCNLMTLVVKLVHQLVVGVLVAEEESGRRRTLVDVSAVVKQLAVGFDVDNVDGIVEG